MLPNFKYVRPASLRDCVDQVDAGAVVSAGGTDLLGCLRDGVFSAEKVVSLTGIKDLSGISVKGSDLRIGALTTLTEIATSLLVSEHYKALAQAVASVGSPQIRNQGTIGGNVCQRPRCWYFRGDFPCVRKGGNDCFALGGENVNHAIFGADGCCMVHPSDTAPALIALDAHVSVVGPSGARSIPVGEFFVPASKDVTRETVLQKGDIVTEIVLPAAPQGLRSSYRKVRARGSWDFAVAGVAIALKLTGKKVESVRVVLSGVAPIPWRASEAEKALIGKRPHAESGCAGSNRGHSGCATARAEWVQDRSGSRRGRRELARVGVSSTFSRISKCPTMDSNCLCSRGAPVHLCSFSKGNHVSIHRKVCWNRSWCAHTQGFVHCDRFKC
jgi:xanthine dehydrogenase YagS FAD-binding subunit